MGLLLVCGKLFFGSDLQPEAARALPVMAEARGVEIAGVPVSPVEYSGPVTAVAAAQPEASQAEHVDTVPTPAAYAAPVVSVVSPAPRSEASSVPASSQSSQSSKVVLAVPYNETPPPVKITATASTPTQQKASAKTPPASKPAPAPKPAPVAKPAPKPATKPTAQSGWTVQAAALSTSAAANDAAAKLKQAGYRASVVASGSKYRVVVSCATQSEAASTAAKIDKLGFP
ncbi:MAG: SPOR domain-containing protein, partial [Synergistaceae bacterium]|nr:SPOR domain-containing protein [Synergistaceae bacterium]